MNENENTICANVWDTAKAALRWEFTALNAYIKMEIDLKSIKSGLKKIKKSTK